VSVTVTCCFPIPKSTPKKHLQAMREGLIRHIKKPDGDNVGKAVLDGLNKVAFADDSQVAQFTVAKFYADEPCVMVDVRQIHP